MVEYLKKILSSDVYAAARETPLEPMARLSERLDARVLLKREDLQPIHSFKLRGAYNKMARLSADELKAGVICASAGNHAQGVAFSAGKLGTAATIVMPVTTPPIKIEAVRALGGKVVLAGDGYDDAFAHARGLAQEHGLTFVHAYDDPDVIAGQGTIGMEILRQSSGEIGAIFVPVGGGGLAAGIGAYVKALRPDIKVIGVEPDDAASMAAALKAGKPVQLERTGLFADGVSVRKAGEETFRICREVLDAVITVSGDEICAAIKDIFDDTRAIAEPAGALAVAGIKKYVEQNGAGHGQLVAIHSGANMNFDRLRHIAERAEIGEHREALLAVTIPEKPGSYRAFVEALGRRPITEFNYRYADNAAAQVFAGVQIDGTEERGLLVSSLMARGYQVTDLTDNEMAKLHIRHMVGGRSAGVENERIFRFQFPERPGALFEFLTRMAGGWNISLFHYRNHGADHGRVLAGIQVPPADRARFDAFLTSLGFDYWEETDNPAYRLFLQHAPLQEETPEIFSSAPPAATVH